MPYTPTTWVEGVTTLGPTNMNKIEQGIASLSSPAPNATPPASPADGDIWYLPADATNGSIWQFRYNAGSASTYKWEFVGGSRMAREGVGGMNWNVGEGTNSGSFTTLATAGPALTIARAGEYVLEGQASSTASAAGAADRR